MSAPLYFLPGVFTAQLLPGGKLCRSILRERGLEGVFADVGEAREDLVLNEINSAGPGGKPGLLTSILPVSRQPPRRVVYDKADPHQVWTAHRHGDVWVGIDTMSPVVPDDLLRKDPLGGHPVVLNGQTWLVPAIRCPVAGGRCDLPQAFAYDDDGAGSMRIRPQYQQLWERSALVADLAFVFGQKAVSYGELAEIAIETLALNYRFSKLEQTRLAVLDQHNVREVLRAMVDYPRVQAALAEIEAQKKTESEAAATSTNSSPGGAGSCPATAPPGETFT